MLNLYNHKCTQKTYRKLTSQVVNMYGVPIRYLPKVESTAGEGQAAFGGGAFGDDEFIQSNFGVNHLYGEDVNLSFKDAIPMKAMLENYDGYEGIHNIFDKMGFSMSDEIRLSLEIESWRNIVEKYGYPMQMPREGDIIAFDLAEAKNGRPQLFEIKYCNESQTYFAFGSLYVFALTCVVWEYSHEKLQTGDPIIDSLNVLQGDVLQGDNAVIDKLAKKVTNWNPNDPFGEKD